MGLDMGAGWLVPHSLWSLQMGEAKRRVGEDALVGDLGMSGLSLGELSAMAALRPSVRGAMVGRPLPDPPHGLKVIVLLFN